MKRRKMILAVTASLAVLAAGCASAPAPAAYTQNEPRTATAQASADARQTANKARVLDWANRGLGEEASPAWLLPAVRGNWKIFKQDWEIRSDKVLKVGVSRAPALNAAMTIADVQYAARLANQLKQSVINKAAITLGSDDQFSVVNDVATKTTVTIAGQERLTDFWQLRETVDKNGKTTTVYDYYVVYACDPDVWSKLVAKYMFDLTDKIPDQRAKAAIAGMFAEIDAETRYEKEKSEAQFATEIRAQQAALVTPIAPAAQRAAYRSGDPAKIAAAGTTAADTDYIAALAALAGIE
ncbi:hypothetical protein AGMMS49579_24380 [Spirochaetia bacterium]|nr:hypothetical protein AGMMS49579_24380 [Spirochaetia bacterium]